MDEDPLLDVTNSVAIQRLIEEIRLDDEAGIPRGYNRTYSRHNRSGPWPSPIRRPLPPPTPPADSEP